MKDLRDQFLHPAEEFTPIPFWFWNDYLTIEEIKRQIHDFYEKGVTGFVLHPRIGIPEDIGYLSDDFMELVYGAVREACKLGMRVVLYDEGMYPSGSANGQVVKEDSRYASRGLKMVEHSIKQGRNEISLELDEGDQLVSIQAVEKLSNSSLHHEKTIILKPTEDKVVFTPPSEGQWSMLFFIETDTKGTIRGIHFGEDDGEKNAPPSADLLNPDAVRTYIRLTHERYYAVLKEYFGETVIGMFTDEPDMLGRNALPGLKPWTRNFLDVFIQDGNEESDLSALWYDVGAHTSDIKKRYRQCIHERVRETYYRPISEWCQSHGIALTGHPAKSGDIGLLDYFQIPGQDVVWRWVAPEEGKALEGEHSTVGKCSSDAARHRGRRRNLNEVLGVCGKESSWALSPGDMKWYFDWLFVRGVNLLCPHAFYYSINGKKRSHERPPDVGPNNSWWPYYHLFSQYIKRMSWVMTDSVNQTEIAVLCEEDHLPWRIVKPLYKNQIEFNYLEDSLLKDCFIGNGKIQIEKQMYKVVLVENTLSLHTEMVERLQAFIKTGGRVICLSHQYGKLLEGATVIENEANIIEEIDKNSVRQVSLSPGNTDIRISKVEKQGCLFYVVVNEGEEMYNGKLLIAEKGKVECWDSWNGVIGEVGVHCYDGKFAIPLEINRRESIVYYVMPEEEYSLPSDDMSSQYKTKDVIVLQGEWVIKKGSLLWSEKHLASWSNWNGLEYYSGTLVYETQFEMKEVPESASYTLDLGEVYEIASVQVNEEPIGVKMWAPYRFELDQQYLQIGTNKLIVEVTNSKANEMDNVSLQSGLVGPVVIEVEVPLLES